MLCTSIQTINHYNHTYEYLNVCSFTVDKDLISIKCTYTSYGNVPTVWLEAKGMYMCLGEPVADTCGTQTNTYITDNDLTITAYDVEEIITDSSDSSTDTEQWEEENIGDPYDSARLQSEAHGGQDNEYLSQLYWAQRKAQRRYRAAKQKFGPRRHFKRKRLGRKFARKHSFNSTKPNFKGKFRAASFLSC